MKRNRIWLAVALACAAPKLAFAAWSVGAGVGNFNSNSLSNSITITCAAICDVPIYEQFNPGTGASVSSAVIDGALNATPAGSPLTDSAETGQLYYALGLAAGTHTIVVTYTVSAQNALAAFGVMGGAHAVDGSGGVGYSNFQGNTANAVQGFTITTTTNGDFIASIGNWVSVSTTLSAGTSPNAFTAITGCAASSLCQYAIQGSAGAITPTMNSVNTAGILTGTIALQPAVGGGGGSTQPEGPLLGVGQ